jgi:hypothetical protein
VSKHLVARIQLNDDDLEPLVRRTLAGDPVARHDLWVAVDPAIERIAGRFRFMSRLDERYDDCRNLAVGVVDRLYADDYRRLGLFHAVLLRREGTALAWLSAVTARLSLDHLEAHAENLGGRRRAFVHVVPLTEGLEELLPESMRAVRTADAHRIWAHAERTFSPPELLALRLWCDGTDAREIAAELGLGSGRAAESLVRAVIRRLRRWLRLE